MRDRVLTRTGLGRGQFIGIGLLGLRIQIPQNSNQVLNLNYGPPDNPRAPHAPARARVRRGPHAAA